MKKSTLKKFAVVLGIAALLATSFAFASGILTFAVITTSTTQPVLASEGVPLNFAGTSDPGQPMTKVKVTIKSLGQIVAARINAYRFVTDAGWARDPANDYNLGDAGCNNGAENVSIPDIVYNINGRGSRASFTATGVLQCDAGTTVPVLIIESAAH